MQFLVIALLVHVLCGAAGGASKQKTKSVTTLIEAKWEVTPLVLELAEYLRDENENFLWEFVDGVCVLDPPIADLGEFYFTKIQIKL
jgi:UDP-glucose:glycoprotein glucosyltransferase